MFLKTSNEYRFKYLVTGLTGEGIPCVYLPEHPPDKEILFNKEQKFIRMEPSEIMKEWMDEFESEQERDPNYIHPQQELLNQWEEQEFDRCQKGIWFWNDGEKVYLTGDHYKYLTQWNQLFGYADFRESDKEFFYWIKFLEEDELCYGGAYNTGRRTGKSSKMGFWAMNRTSTNFKHLTGMQGEDDLKIRAFYEQLVIEPFYKLPYYSRPVYDTTTLQKKGIIFKDPPKRNKRRIHTRKKLVLESRMDYRTSEANKYDQAKLHTYVNEEPGKKLTGDIGELWGFVKRCLKLGIKIIGKSLFATTVEFMDVTSKGGRAYKKLCYASDYNIRNKNGETISGLYAAMMPADCDFEGCIDAHGRPEREKARTYIFADREASKDNPKDHSSLIRKHPLNWHEVFYVDTERCEFNATKLQNRRFELMMNPPPIRRFDLRWENNVRFTKVIMIDNPINGWSKWAWVPKNDDEKKLMNNVEMYNQDGITRFKPLNTNIFGGGFDPIDHGIVNEDGGNEEDYVSSRRSKPVLTIKRKYDVSIDGPMSQEILEQRAREHYPYKTNKRVMMMDARPNDPNVLFERVLMVCWLLGCPLKTESQKPGVINWFHAAGCDDFLLDKYIPILENTKRSDLGVKGTPASTLMINEYTDLLSTEIEYFIHVEPFIEFVDDALIFNPLKTKPHDYAVAWGWQEIGCQIRSRVAPLQVKDISSYFRSHKISRNGIVSSSG